MLTAVALLLLAPTPPIAEVPSGRPQLLVTVRQELGTPLSSVTLHQVAAEVRSVWREHVDVDFGPPGALRRGVDDDALELVVTDRMPDGSVSPVLGWIDFVDGEPAKAITVSMGAVRALTDEGKWAGRRFTQWPRGLRDTFLARALGRGIAHELGHYLLRSKAHTARGLMRERFSVAELMDRGVARYRLDASELALLERRTTSYRLARRMSPEPSPQ
jgi:hypothetical protein